jgi:hypothetical protein
MTPPSRLSFREFTFHSKPEYTEPKYAVYKQTFPMENQNKKLGGRCGEKNDD